MTNSGARSSQPGVRKQRQVLFVPLLLSAATCFGPAMSQGAKLLEPGNLVISRSVYTGNAATVTVGQSLPPGCANATGGAAANCVSATNDGVYPGVFNNALVDGSFGITSPLFLDEIDLGGAVLKTLNVPDNPAMGDHLVTSFSSKSEVALNLSTDGKYLTFMGYVETPNALDVSNSNTPSVVDATNPVGENVYRAVARLDADGNFTFTKTNAYSGNNGRAAVLSNSEGEDLYYASGNAGNGSNPQPVGVIAGAGSQLIKPSDRPESEQNPGTPTPVGSFNVRQINSSYKDKIGKDDNFRGLALYKDVVYLTKGSGGNGVNTVYFIDTSGGACTATGSGGTGLPSASPALPTSPLTYDPATLQKKGLPSNICILNGFPAIPNSLNPTPAHPFGIWFANPTTLYVADEGDGFSGDATLYSHAAADSSVAAAERFAVLQTAPSEQVLRGIAFTPDTDLKPPSQIMYPVTSSGLLYNPFRKSYTGSLTVRNNTPGTLSGPVYVELRGLDPAIEVSGGIEQDGYRAVLVLPANSTLKPGASANAFISFGDPKNVTIRYTPVVSVQ